jgi:hypothetical protein
LVPRCAIALRIPVQNQEVVPLCNESRRSNACAALSDEDFARVIVAAESYLSSRSVLSSVIATLGNVVHRGLAMVPEEWRDPITSKIHETLVLLQGTAVVNMDDDPGRGSKDWLYAASVIASGIAGGAGGLPALLIELPITTGLMLRSIADIGSTCRAPPGPDVRATWQPPK